MALEEFFIAEGALESSSPQEEQIMHEGISTSKVSASLLQGNTVPIIISLFYAKERQFQNRIRVQAWSPAWPDGCGSPCAASASVSLPSGWKSTVVRSIPINA